MSIIGNTVGTPMPRTDYTQTDKRKADYLKGKDVLDQKILDAQIAANNAVTSASKAETTALGAIGAATNAANTANSALNAANSAASKADNALPKAGGSMAGNINMNNFKITGLPAPTQNSDPVTKAHMEEYLTTYVNNTFIGGEW